jgi:hypothetical protein
MDADEARSNIDRAFARMAKANKKYGFIECPKCRTKHVGKTIKCRGCGYQVTIPEEAVRKIKEEIL